MDVRRDTYPYIGCNTTADALWMGVLVVTLAGPTGTTRQSVAALIHVGLRDLVTDGPTDHVPAAARLAGDQYPLRRLRSGLRDWMKRSPLTVVPRPRRQLEDAYRGMRQQGCSSPRPEGPE